MRLLKITLGSALCALALLAAPVQAKDKTCDKPAACRCKPDSCKCEKKGICKCPEASCTCEKCKAVRANQPAPAAPTAPAAKSAIAANAPVGCDDDDDDDDDDKDCAAPAFNLAGIESHCGKCDKKDGDKPETCPDKAPCCPSKDAPAAQLTQDGDKPETCPDKAPCCPSKDAPATQLTQDIESHCGKCDKKDGDKPETCPDKAPCCPGKEDKSA